MNLTEKIAHQTLARWQRTLRLNDWDITIKIMDHSWRKSGDIKIDLEDRKAVLLLNEKPKCQNLDELVIHELMHLKLWEMDQMIEELIDAVYGKKDTAQRDFAYTQFMKTLETTVEDLTKGLLAAAKCKSPLSFGRLSCAIEAETSARRRPAG